MTETQTIPHPEHPRPQLEVAVQGVEVGVGGLDQRAVDRLGDVARVQGGGQGGRVLACLGVE